MVAASISGCQTIGFYSQSVVGHSKLMLARTSIDSALEKVDSHTADKLILSKELRAFASSSLSLPDNNTYSKFVKLDREYPVWVVVAAPELSLMAKSWCYLVIGCASYRGYFSKQAALRYSNKLKAKGWETYVGGAAAYSTLGWFSDPLLPSMMTGSDASFAEILFHELAHQRLYLKGKSDVNEAMATVVGEQGALRWLASNQPDQVQAYREQLAAQDDFSELVFEFKTKLTSMYQLTQPIADKRIKKKQLFSEFKQRLRSMKAERWNGRGYFDLWLSQPLSNARFAGFSTYRALVSDFENLLVECENDFEKFFLSVEKHNGHGSCH